MSIANQINKNLIDPENHGAILNAIIRVLEEEGEKGVKALIERFVKEIEQELPPNEEESEA
jgi:hypothetical protein